MDTKIQTMLNILASQRNQALDAGVQLQAELAARDEEIAQLKARVEELSKLDETVKAATPAPAAQ